MVPVSPIFAVARDRVLWVRRADVLDATFLQLLMVTIGFGVTRHTDRLDQ